MPNGSLRKALGKSDLSKMMKENVCGSQLSISLNETCTVINGIVAIQSLASASAVKMVGECCDKFSEDKSQCGIFDHLSPKLCERGNKKQV